MSGLAKTPFVAVDRLTMTYPNEGRPVEALADVSFSLAHGESLAVIGPSGCGKSTLLLVLAGLLTPSGGEVSVDGRPVQAGWPGAALILQDYGLFPWKTVAQNAELGLVLRGEPAHRRAAIVGPILDRLGLAPYCHLYPPQLSGGMRQRVAIARALALEASLLLLDEPFSALDALTREQLQDELLDLWTRHRPALVLVTHSIEEAAYLGQRVLVLSPRPGRPVAVVSNDLAGDPEARRRPAFFELCAHLRGLLAGGRDTGQPPCPEGAASPRAVPVAKPVSEAGGR